MFHTPLQVTIAVCQTQRPLFQTTTLSSISLLWKISSLERENYLFVCSCPKCLAQADDPDITSEEEEEEEDDAELEGEAEDAELEDEMTDV
ncbi:SET and MYND domain-containing protein 5-like [Xenopus tropicalis]|uniref:SET and MYND domain-containing protein 5-like n=1 Tax=Xenopus tropicalis TaxID=8364 RepID=A0A8J1IZX8_XENTR|nr:SET and MYND domain-containing protein 5-like [Xenopus tropicalis]